MSLGFSEREIGKQLGLTTAVVKQRVVLLQDELLEQG